MSARDRLAQLAGEMRVLLAEMDAAVGGPVKPDEYVSNLWAHGSITPGWTWRPTDGWSIHATTVGPDRNAVYVHTPSCSFPSDVTPLWPDEARDLARALASAADAVDAQQLIPSLAPPSRPNPATTGATS